MAQIDDTTLMAYVDGELDAVAMRHVADAIEGDPEGREKVRLLRQSAKLVRAVFEDPAYARVPPSLAKAVLTPRNAAAMRFESWRFAWPVAASIAAAVLFAGGFMLGDIHGRQPFDFSERLRGEIVDYHLVYAQEQEHQIEVPAAQLDHIQAWLGERLNRTLRVPDLSAHGLAFQGARLLVVNGK